MTDQTVRPSIGLDCPNSGHARRVLCNYKVLLIDLGNVHDIHTPSTKLSQLYAAGWEVRAYSDFAYTAPVDLSVYHRHCSQVGMNVADSYLLYDLFTIAQETKNIEGGVMIAIASNGQQSWTQMLTMTHVLKEKAPHVKLHIVRGWDEMTTLM